MKKLIIIILLIFVQLKVNAQQECAVIEESPTSSDCITCSDFNKYKTYIYNTQNTPIKNIRIIMHVFNKDDGTGNLQDNSVSRNWLTGVVATMNYTLANLQPMNLSSSTPTPNYGDARIRYVLDDIYFWDGSDGFNTGYDGNAFLGVGTTALYNTYVTNNPLVDEKETAIHLFLGGISTPNNGYAQLPGNYMTASGALYNYQNGFPDMMANIISHELGHCLGLYHSFMYDECDDTPNNSNCWNGPTCSTNMMDYNAQKWSLTQCQINKIHYNLLKSTGPGKCVINTISADNSIITGNDVICTTTKEFTIPNLQFGVTASWSASPSTNVVMPNPCGAPVLISTNTSAISSTTLSATLCYGKYGSLSVPNKLLAINTLSGTTTLICGNGTGVITGASIQSSPYPPCTTPFYTTTGQKTKLVANSFIELNQFEFGQGSDVELVISSCP